jgi:glycerol-3-phosphate dehydrogenase (NAD(P)+)
MAEPQHITIVGDGAMATACALLLDSKGHRVRMWGPFDEHVREMVQQRENRRYLPSIPLPESLHLTSEPDEAVGGRVDLVVSAIPTQYLRRVWERFTDCLPADAPVVSVTKGIENETLLRPTQIIADIVGGDRKLASMSGPSIADELARCLPATVAAASEDADFARLLQQTFTTRWFRVYTHADLLGVELAGATKNVIALAAGILDGLQAGNNAKSALLSRGLAEITRLGVAMGAEAETFFGITGVGDLATTCFSPTGRNRSAGEMLGKGRKLEQVLEEVHGIVEGVPTTKSVMQLAAEHEVEMPITAAVNAVLFEGLDPIEGISMLMSREPKAERIG